MVLGELAARVKLFSVVFVAVQPDHAYVDDNPQVDDMHVRGRLPRAALQFFLASRPRYGMT
jgi:hypothetical protein